MSKQVIPETAIEAALKAWGVGGEVPRNIVAAILESAAPHLIQVAKRDAWDEGWQKAHATDDPAMAGIFFNPYRSQS